MSARHRLLPILLIASIPATSWGCEPILPLAQLLGGSSFAGPMFLTKSLVWLLVAVAIKCFSFVFLERRLTWPKAVLFMLVANILSTIPGVLIAAFAASVGGMILAVPIVFLLGILINRRLRLLTKPGKAPFMSAGSATFVFMAVFLASILLFGFATGAMEADNYRAYWILKFFFVTLVACTGIIISAVLEEYVIAQCTKKSHSNQSFYPSVFRANYITLGFVLLVAAIQILPKRLNSPHFITSWLHTLSSFLGLA